jgi:Flp pilus assembly pilin Flp
MITRLIKEEEGSQTMEYALVMAIFSISLALALQPGALEASVDIFLVALSGCLVGACP